MKAICKSILSIYFHSWWLPTTVFLGLTLLTIGTAGILFLSPLEFLIYPLLLGTALAFLGIALVAVGHLYMERSSKGHFQFFMFAMCGAAIVVGFLVVTSNPAWHPVAENLTVPEGIVFSAPKSEPDARPGSEEDGFQARILKALAVPGGEDASVTTDVTALQRLQREAPDLLLRYLAASPAWRVFEDGRGPFATREGRFATRRWMIGSRWQYVLQGHYNRYLIGAGSMPELADFQMRLTIGLSGERWAGNSYFNPSMRAGETVEARLVQDRENGLEESAVVIRADDLVVDIFEKSGAKERRLTKAALAHLEEEFRPLAETPDVATIRARLLPSGVRRGAPSFELRRSEHRGVYTSEVWLNPGEPGMIHLKAFEVMGKVPLSAELLKRRSNEWIGWSDVPDELFFSNTEFIIYEAFSGGPYDALFEVWFVPDSGAPERKLLEKGFKIEGW